MLREHIVSCSALLGLACECGAINVSRGVGGGRSPPHLQNIEWDGKALLLAKSCKYLLAQKLPKKNERGGWGGRSPPPICKTSNKMRTCRFLLSLARFCENMSCLVQRR